MDKVDKSVYNLRKSLKYADIQGVHMWIRMGMTVWRLTEVGADGNRTPEEGRAENMKKDEKETEM